MKARFFDFIICGAGCAGLSLAKHLMSPKFSDKKILIIDKDEKILNDRTWSFWEAPNKESFYSKVVSNEWGNVRISNHNSRFVTSLHPLVYKRIRSIDFYNLVKSDISRSPNVFWLKDEIQSIDQLGDQEVVVSCSSASFHGGICFTSIPINSASGREYSWKQHFLGYVVKFNKQHFDETLADLMDFRMEQYDGVRFCYTLPFSNDEALVEMTIFSEELLCDKNEYHMLLDKYIKEFISKDDYVVKEEEFGVIPMTTEPILQHSNSRIINIGNRSGRIKPSTGYAFTRIQDEVKGLVRALENDQIPSPPSNKNRFLFYDKILFNVLTKQRMKGNDVFTIMFENNKASDVLTFLEEKTNLLQEIRLFASMPKMPFVKALISEVRRKVLNG